AVVLSPLSFNAPASTQPSTLSLHDALPISFGGLNGAAAEDGSDSPGAPAFRIGGQNIRQVTPRNTPTVINAAFHVRGFRDGRARSEEHTSELQSRSDLVCRLLLEKKKIETT